MQRFISGNYPQRRFTPVAARVIIAVKVTKVPAALQDLLAPKGAIFRAIGLDGDIIGAKLRARINNPGDRRDANPGLLEMSRVVWQAGDGLRESIPTGKLA